MFFGTNTQIGVSIGTSSVKVAELKKNGKSYTLKHFGVAQLPDGAIVNREIINQVAVLDSLKNLVNSLKIKGKQACISISGAAVIIKKISLDQTPDNELEDAILWEAEQYIPFDINEVVFDYQLINKSGPDGKMEILLVAVKRAIIDTYLAILKDAGLNAKVVDCDIFGLQNAFEVNHPNEKGTVALVDIGASSTKFTIVTDGVPVYTRDAAVGGQDLTAEIQRHLNLSYQEAEILKIDGQSKGQLPQEVSDLMQVSCDSIAGEIKRSLDFFIASNAGAQVGYVMLSGGASKLPNLSKTVEEAVSLPVQVLNPFEAISADTKLFNQDYLSAISGIAAIPIGLAIRGFSK